MAEIEKNILEQRRLLFSQERIKIKKRLVAIGKQLASFSPTSPMYSRLQEEKDELTVQLFGKDIDSEQKLARLGKRLGLLEQDYKEKRESKKKPGWFTDILEDIQDSLLYKTTKLTYNTLKGVAKLGSKGTSLATKAILNSALTRKVDRQRKFGISYGGTKQNKYKFNDNLFRKFSKDYKDLNNSFYMLGKGVYNRKVKKGELDASDVIEYLREQGKSSQEIIEQLSIFMEQGMIVSSGIQNMLKQYSLDENENTTKNNSDVSSKNVLISLDQKNKEVLEETLMDFYQYIDSKKEKKDKKGSGIWGVLGGIVGALGNIGKGLGKFAFFLFGNPLVLAIAGAVSAAFYFYGDEISKWIKESLGNLWDWVTGEESGIDPEISRQALEKASIPQQIQNEFIKIPGTDEYGAETIVHEVPKVTATGKPIPEDIRSYIKEASELTGVDPYRIAARIETESGWKENAVSDAGAKGLMQFMDNTWREEGSGNVFDRRANILAGAKYIKKTENWTGNRAEADAAYNWGIGNLNKAKAKYGDNWLKHAPKETQDYVLRNAKYQNQTLAMNRLNESSGVLSTPKESESIQPQVNEKIIEKNVQQTPIEKSTQKSKNINKAKGFSPISIPSHLGGGDLNVLNTGARF